MALVAETSVVIYVYSLRDSGPGHDEDELVRGSPNSKNLVAILENIAVTEAH